MAAEELELPLQLEAREKVKSEQLNVTPKCIAFNVIFSLALIFPIFHAINVNNLSNYNAVDLDDGYTGSVSGYFECGWTSFSANYCDDTCHSTTKDWLQQYNDCMLFRSSDYCDSYNISQRSGLLWYYCNIIALISLIISEVGYVIILLQKKYFKSFKKMYIGTILFQSFIPTLLLLIGIIYWFQTNYNTGCWNKQYQYMFTSPNLKQIVYGDKELGESMIFDIIAVSLVGIHLFIHIHLVLGNGGNKKKRNIKHREPMLAEEGEGYLNEHIENIQIEIEPGADNMADNMDDGGYLSIKTWFDASVNIPNDIKSNNYNYKQNYYDKFIENGFDNFVAIKSMNNQDLIDIGIDKLGHRKTILIAIQKL